MKNAIYKIEDLIVEENSAIEALASFMVRMFDASINWRSEKKCKEAMSKRPKQAKAAKLFWDECIKKFEMYSATLSFEYVRESKLSDDLYDKVEKTKLKEISEIKISWLDEIEELEEIYDYFDRRYLFHSPLREECRELFYSLKTKLLEARQRDAKRFMPKAPLLGRVTLSYLSQIVDLKNSAVCELLPYLLTAFTSNFWKSRLFYGYSTFSERAFEGNADSTEAVLTRKQLESLSRSFSLAMSQDDFVYNKSKRPSVTLQLTKTPYIKNVNLLEDVFIEWCEIIPECAHRARLQRLEKNVNFDKCRMLFDYYVNSQDDLKDSC